MNFGTLADRLAQFWANNLPGLTLEEADPECAEALADFWKMHQATHFVKTGQCVAQNFAFFESQVALRVAEIMQAYSDIRVRNTLLSMGESRAKLVKQAMASKSPWEITPSAEGGKVDA